MCCPVPLLSRSRRLRLPLSGTSHVSSWRTTLRHATPSRGRSGDDDRNGDRYQLRLLGTGLLLGDVSLAVRGGALGIAAPAARPPTTKKYRFALAASSICIVSRDPADLPLATFPVRTVAPSDRGSDPVGMQESGMPGSGTSTFIDSEGAAAHWRPAFRHLRVSPQMSRRQAH